MKELLENKWQQAMSFDQYAALMNRLVEEEKTTGPNQSAAMVQHTKMAAQRIKKWSKIFNLLEEDTDQLKGKAKGQNWLLITEAWCGDVGQNLIPLQKIANAAGAELKLILRDDNLDLMDKFLTNGGRSIPKLIVFEADSKEVLWDWGPRPQEIQKWFLGEKSKEAYSYEKTSEAMHLWYAKNKHQALLSEFKELLG